MGEFKMGLFAGKGATFGACLLIAALISFASHAGTAYAAMEASDSKGAAAEMLVKGDAQLEAQATVSAGWNEAGTCEWSKSGTQLLIRPANNAASGELPAWGSANTSPWANSRSEFTKVVVQPGVKATSCAYLFAGLANVSQIDLSGLDTSQATDFSYMFSNCLQLRSLDLSALDTSRATSFSHMFASCSMLSDIDASAIDTTNATTFECMFQHCSSLTSLNVAGWNTGKLTNAMNAFSECPGLRSLDFAKWDLTNLETAKMMFEGDNHLERIDLSPFRRAHKLTDVYAMFNQCPNLRSVNVRSMDLSHVEYIAHFLEGCRSLKTVDMSGMDLSSVVDADSLFTGDDGLVSVNLSEAKFTQNTTFGEAFKGCTKLKTIDMSNMYAPWTFYIMGMFYGCSSLETLNLQGATFDVIESAANAFYGCSSLKSLDLSGIRSANKSYTTIFYGCYADSYKPMRGFTAAGPLAHPSISQATCSAVPNAKFTGGYITPAVKLSVGDNASYVWGNLWGSDLVQGRDYTVTYSNNKKVGKAKVTITGKGIFRGSVTKTFKITKK